MAEVSRSDTGWLIACDAVGQVSITGPAVSSWGQYGSMEERANAAFLTPITFNQPGVLFAYIFHCQNVSPVRLQVWRPTTRKTSYTLVCQRRVVPDIEHVRRRVVVSRAFNFHSTAMRTTTRCLKKRPTFHLL